MDINVFLISKGICRAQRYYTASVRNTNPCFGTNYLDLAEAAIYKFGNKKTTLLLATMKQFDVEGTLNVIFKAAQNSFSIFVGSNPQASKCHQCVTGAAKESDRDKPI